MKAREIRDYLKTLDGGWVDWERTVDTFKSGDPEADVTGIAVGWMNYRESLERALMLGCNVFVCHEPLYYNHTDTDEKVFEVEAIRAKREWVEQTGLIVLRCHDLWDQVKGIGIPDSWGTLLELGEPIDGDGYYRIYDGGGRTAEEIARSVAARTRKLGQDAVQLLGPPEARVSRIAIGTGAITPFTHLVERYDADLVICTDDGFSYWRDGALAIDMGVPVVVVNHATSEVYGMRLLARHLREAFPDVPVHYIPQGCMYRLITADGG